MYDEDNGIFGDIQLDQEASVDVSGEGTGRVLVRAEGVRLTNGSVLLALGDGDPGTLSVQATEVELIGTSANGIFPSGLIGSLNSGATGKGGTLEIGAERVTIREGAQVIASTFGEGDAANLTVNATEVELLGTSADGLFPSGLFAEVNPNATGNGGTVKIGAERVSVRDGALVTASTFGNGNAANLTVNATEVELLGTSADGQFFSGLFANVGAEAEGNGGNLEINVERLSVQDGAQVLTTTLGQGNAGNLTVKAAQVELRGRSADGQIVSGLFASGDNLNANVQGGTLDIRAEQLTIEDSAQMSVSNIGVGRPGNIDVSAVEIRLDNEASITAESAVGAGGNITLVAPDIQLRRSRILAVGSGEGLVGDVEIDADLLILLRDSGIITEAANPTGGRIMIVSTDVVRSQNSLIQANGESIGTELGNVEIFESRQIQVSDPESLIAQNPCKQDNQSQFIITGRGGLPPNPLQGSVNRRVSVGLADAIPQETPRPSGLPQRTPSVEEQVVSSRNIIPARGWIRNQKGEVILVSYDPTGIQPQHRQRPVQQAPTCQIPQRGS